VCELLALSTTRPARLTFSLQTLAQRASASGTTHDGWGVAFYQGNDVALFREPSAASGSPLVHFLSATTLATSHIRHATHGAIQLSNTQLARASAAAATVAPCGAAGSLVAASRVCDDGQIGGRSFWCLALGHDVKMARYRDLFGD
jgi:hypothetical protein